jgi:uncharacterized membrane protein
VDIVKLIRLLKWELAAEAKSWVDQGIISTDQADRILDCYGTQLPEEGKRAKMQYVALMSIATFMFAIAVILLIGHNWQEIPRGLRVAGLVVATAIFGAGGIHFQKTNPLRSNQLFFFNSLMFGASVFLIGQIYHLGAYFPNGLLVWLAGIVPIALMTRSLLVHGLVAFVGHLWLLLETGFGYIPYIYVALAFFGFYYIVRQRTNLLLYIMYLAGSIFFVEVLVSHLMNPSMVRFDFEAEHVMLTAGIFLVLYSWVSYALEKVKNPGLEDYFSFTQVWSVRFAILAMLVMSFEVNWNNLIRFADYASPSVYLVVSACALISVFPNIQRKSLPGLLLIAAYALLSLLPAATGESSAAVFAIVTNVIVLLTGIYLIRKGVRDSLGASFFLGVATIVILAFLRYVDLIGDYIGGSLMFMIGAGVVFGAAKYWNRHVRIENEQ